MKVILPKEIVEMLINELEKAGTREIGGILMGEHLSNEEFKVCDITVQRLGGGFAFFEMVFPSTFFGFTFSGSGFFATGFAVGSFCFVKGKEVCSTLAAGFAPVIR